MLTYRLNITVLEVKDFAAAFNPILSTKLAVYGWIGVVEVRTGFDQYIARA